MQFDIKYRSILTRCFLFFAGLLLTYLLLLVLLSRIENERIYFRRGKIIKAKSSILKKITGNRRTFGFAGMGYSIKRFTEIEKFEDVDILFVGSSHTYRAFDPRIFKKAGIKTFNMGSTSQTPLNTYYLLKRYFEKLNPKLVVFEVCWKVFASDGIESFYDLSANLTFSVEMLEMALAIKNPHAIHVLISDKMTNEPIKKVMAENQKKFRGYISGGYCESFKKLPKEDVFGQEFRQVLLPVQFDYLRKIIRFVQKNSKIILVLQPIPKEMMRLIINRDEISETFKKITAPLGVPYLDFNKTLELETHVDFKDRGHLNAMGVKKFNKAFLEALSKINY